MSARVKYVGESATGYRNPATDETMSVVPGSVYEVPETFATLLLATAQFVVPDDVPEKTIVGPGGSVRVSDK